MTKAKQVRIRRMKAMEQDIKTEAEKVFRWIREYNLLDVLVKYDREKFFKRLKKTIDQEEGYTAKLDLNTTYWDAKATILEVVIE